MRALTAVCAVLAVTCVAVAVAASSRVELEEGLFGSEGHARARAHWTRVRRAEPDAPIRLTFAVSQQNLETLESTLYAVSDPDSPQYGQHLSRDEVDAMVAPSSEAVATVRAWLDAHDLTVTGATGNSDFLFVDTLVESAERLLGVQYHVFEADAPQPKGMTHAHTRSNKPKKCR